MSRWRRIVIHHSSAEDGPKLDFPSIRRYHMEQRGYADIGYHFLVEKYNDDLGSKSFVATCGRPLNMAGAHAKGANADSIGVCFIGNYMEAAPPMPMLVAGARLIAGLIEACGLLDYYQSPGVDGVIVPHRGTGTTATDCPGIAFIELGLPALRDLVREYGRW